MKFLKNINNIHFVGIGGVSMSALAKLCLFLNKKVTGTDDYFSDTVTNLKNLGIMIYKTTPKSVLKSSELIVYTAAIPTDHPDLEFARLNNTKIIERAQFLGLLCEQFKECVAVAGTHGKTTTTAMLANCLQSLSPTTHIGGFLPELGNLILGKKSIFITEACEFNKSFLHLSPNVCIITNIEKEHMDCFKNEKDLINSFYQFAHQTKDLIVIKNDNPILHKLLTEKPSIITFGIDDNSDIVAKNLNQTNGKFSFDCYYKKELLGNINLNVFGKHNVLNALSVIAVALYFKLDFNLIKDELEKFNGVERRFQFLKTSPFTIIHDYAHHPTEIKETLKTAKLLNKNKVVCIFEPHTYSRTKSLMKEFCESFYDADKLYLLPTYSAREQPIKDGSSFDLFLNLPEEIDCEYYEDKNKLFNQLLKTVENDDLIIFLGAGTIGEYSLEFLKLVGNE